MFSSAYIKFTKENGLGRVRILNVTNISFSWKKTNLKFFFSFFEVEKLRCVLCPTFGNENKDEDFLFKFTCRLY